MSVDYTEDIQYAANRLSETVVLHNKIPIYVGSLEGSTALCRKLPSSTRVDVPLHLLDLTPIKLGYVNELKECYYLMRVPARQWRQGLRSSQLMCLNNWTRNFNMVRSSGFYNMVMNKYPTLAECFESFVNEESVTKAFSLHFALHKSNRKDFGMNLAYAGSIVGTAAMGDSRVTTTLAPKYSYLSELLEEERNGRP
jgi:hypothetical protein